EPSHSQDSRVYVQNVLGRQTRGQGNNARGTGAVGIGGAQNRVGNANSDQERQIKCYNCNAQENGVVLDEEQLFIAGGQDNVVDEDVEEPSVQDLALNVDNLFQTDECDAFDSDVDKAPTAQTMFTANLSFADPIMMKPTHHVHGKSIICRSYYDEADPSYDLDILSEVHDHDNYQDVVCEHHEVYEMHGDVQPNCAVNSDAEYTGDSNIIPYDKMLFVSIMKYMICMVMYNQTTLLTQMLNIQTKVVDASLTAELATYKEQVEIYERRAKFELTEREQKIEEQLRIVITDYIQCAGSDTRPPMLDRTDFAPWQQCIRLYFRGKDNRVNILKSIDEGPFQIGMIKKTLDEGEEGTLHLGPERARVYSDLSPKDKERYCRNYTNHDLVVLVAQIWR
nr:hypothetical protein [Tanacetum cinerariifolium]